MRSLFAVLVFTLLLIVSCQTKREEGKMKTFKDDVEFLKQYTNVVILSDEDNNAKVVIVPEWQGRVMTSAADGDKGLSFGWINRELIASGEKQPHINVYGGEDRFWLGPEGGQFSIFFENGVPFDLEHWFVPPAIDTEPFEVVQTQKDRASFRREMNLKNYSDFEFKLEVNREIRLVNNVELKEALNMSDDLDAKAVAYESINKITNIGDKAWVKDTGLLSIWIMGMFSPSLNTTIVIPFEPGPEEKFGEIVNDKYFGKVPPDRLTIKNNVIYFKGDGEYRSKIGLSPKRCKPILGSYDSRNKVITLVQYTLSKGVTDYVNSMWKIQEKPYGGDVINSYNDGPPEPGAKPLGPFYELESSSPAAALAPGQSLTHVHRTIHIQGSEDVLNKIVKSTLGVSLNDIKNAFD